MTSLALRDPVLVKLEAARQYLSDATDLAEVKTSLMLRRVLRCTPAASS